MKILVLVTDYPKLDGSLASSYVHSRNKWYAQKGIDVSVLSFKAKDNYEIDGIKVYTFKTYQNKLKKLKYDILLSHAPNLRNHYKFIKKYNECFDNIVFFFHGHEVLKTTQIYPKPYYFDKKNSLLSTIMRDIYDIFKLRVWNQYFKQIVHKSQFVFVSNWMYKMFIKYIKIDPKLIEDRKHIIYNCVGEQFENNSYELGTEKKFDFITIRNNLDGSKYGIDIVTRIAENNPQYQFCVIGKGKFYKFNKKPNNLELIDRNLTHEEIISFLNQSRCALMPTRADAQGVMVCEMATFGIPVITSDIDICKEIFADFGNVGYINNDKLEIDIEPIFKNLISKNMEQKNTKYFAKNTIGKEIQLFNKILK